MVLGQSQLPDPAQGPLPDVPASAFIALLALGFAVGAFGHLYQWRPAIALGILLIVIAVIVLPLVTLLTGSTP